jgi:hypothetical protein
MPWARSTVWVDAFGYRTITKLVTDGGAATVEPSLEALSNAATTQFWESPITFTTNTPVAAQYQSTSDKCVMIFLCADLTNYAVIVPAPKLSIFLADGETVDQANADVIAFVSAALACPIANPAGSVVTFLIAGYRLPYAKSPLS